MQRLVNAMPQLYALANISKATVTATRGSSTTANASAATRSVELHCLKPAVRSLARGITLKPVVGMIFSLSTWTLRSHPPARPKSRTIFPKAATPILLLPAVRWCTARINWIRPSLPRSCVWVLVLAKVIRWQAPSMGESMYALHPCMFPN